LTKFFKIKQKNSGEYMLQKKWVRWGLAVLITLTAVVYQRMSGPTYPLRGTAEVDGQSVSYKLVRSHGGDGDAIVNLDFKNSDYKAYLIYKRYKVNEEWQKIEMKSNGESLTAGLPHQAPAGKLEYYILLQKDDEKIAIPPHKSVVIRFKGAVPATVLIPHILFMFIAMFMSSVAGLEALANGEKIFRYTLIAAVTLIIGGMILGPIVQKFAFGEYWTGIPWGWDLTDNKTLFALLGWLLAVIKTRENAVKGRWWVVAAAVILIMVYSIPHSAMGSELNYETMKVTTGSV
jgi:hypothetical protein